MEWNCKCCDHKEICPEKDKYKKLMDIIEASERFGEFFEVNVRCRHFISIPMFRVQHMNQPVENAVEYDHIRGRYFSTKGCV